MLILLLGWGVSELLSLSTAGYVALVLIASSPGAPFGAKLAMTQRGDVVVLQLNPFAIGLLWLNWRRKWRPIGAHRLPKRPT
jgi:hypothetical protein